MDGKSNKENRLKVRFKKLTLPFYMPPLLKKTSIKHFWATTILFLACSPAIAQVVITPRADEWGDWKAISETRSKNSNARWFSKDGTSRLEAKELLFISQRTGKVSELASAQRAAAFLLKLQCEGGRINAPEPKIEADSGVAYVQTYCDLDTEYKSGIVAFRKIMVIDDAMATVIRLWKVPIGQARNISSQNADELTAILKERASVSRYMSQQITLCKNETDPATCIK